MSSKVTYTTDDMTFDQYGQDGKPHRVSMSVEKYDALRAECDRLGKIEGQLLAEIEKMKRHHDLFCRCDSVRYGLK